MDGYNFTTDAWQTQTGAVVNPSSNTFNFTTSFVTPKENLIVLRVRTPEGMALEKEIPITISPINTVQITSIKIHEFHNIDSSWDPQFAATDINRLADVEVGLKKDRIQNNTVNNVFFFKSPLKENQADDLLWSVVNDGLYFNTERKLKLFIVDRDEGPNGVVQHLLNYPNPHVKDYVDLDFSPYEATKPASVRFTDPALELDIEFFLNWP